MISIAAADKIENSTNIIIKGQVMNRIFLGEHSEYLVATEGYGEVMVLSPKSVESTSSSFAPGDNVSISWRPEAVLVLGDT
jgi:spermidine/putrescine transport system ATP-binding protein